MPETKKLSISFRVDNGVIEHNNRTFTARNVDAARTPDNITYVDENLQEVYHRLFDEALRKYNERKRSNEKIPDYYEHIKNGKQENLFSEVVVQFGDMNTCGINSENWETAKKMLDEYMRAFQERNPNMIVFGAHLHLDEATPHLHIDFVPICHGQSRGLETRVSLKRALAEQGVSAQSRKKSEWAVWKDVEFEYMTELLHKYGFERDVKNDNHAYLPVEEYRKAAEQKMEIRRINAQINELKKLRPETLTAADFEKIKNQNDFLRGEIIRRDEKIRSLSDKLGAAFVPFEIFSEEKLQFVAAELTTRGIPFVEDNTTLHIPEYEKTTAEAILKSYHNNNQALGIRERIKLDIDRLVYCTADFEDLLSMLERRGYSVKRGKYIAVKAPFAERFVRLKTLGAAYLPQNLETRTADRNKFTEAIQEEHKTATNIEKQIMVTTMNTIIAVKQFRLIPRKSDTSKIYCFQNDENINRLSRQLKTIRDFGFTSREQIYEKAEELQAADTDEAKEQLKRVRELITVYEQVVEGNYIDNLIKAQQQAQKPKNAGQNEQKPKTVKHKR